MPSLPQRAGLAKPPEPDPERLRRLTKTNTLPPAAEGPDISTPAGRRRALMHLYFADYQVLRLWWTNLHQIAPGVWRSNQPSPNRLNRYADMGIRSIITLRGPERSPAYLLEEQACRDHGITLHTRRLLPRALEDRDRILSLLDLFETVDRPVLMHCKSGADRAGLAAALWLLHMEGAEIETAQDQLALRYMHRRDTATGILDHMLRAYATARDETGISIRDWIAGPYDKPALTEDWNSLSLQDRRRYARTSRSGGTPNR